MTLQERADALEAMGALARDGDRWLVTLPYQGLPGLAALVEALNRKETVQ